MGDLGITTIDLGECKSCVHTVPMIFQEEVNDETMWYIACGYRDCGYKSELGSELLDVADKWGIV